MLGQPLFPGESGIDQLVEIIKVLGTPSREQIKTMNPNYMEHKFPQIKPHPFSKVCSMLNKKTSLVLKQQSRSSGLARPPKRLTWYQSCWSTHQERALAQWKRWPMPSFRSWEKKVRECRTAKISLHSSILRAKARMTPFLSDKRHLLTNLHHSELSVRPDLIRQLVPPHCEPELASRTIMLDNFVPIPLEQLKITLD